MQDDDEPVPIDPSTQPDGIPDEIWDAVLMQFEPGDKIAHVATKQGSEWWLFDAEDELIEAFWVETKRDWRFWRW